MWTFSCDRCLKEESFDETNKDNKYAGRLTLSMKAMDSNKKEYDLCKQCMANLDWWLQKIDAIIPLQTTPPPILKEKLIPELTPSLIETIPPAEE